MKTIVWCISVLMGFGVAVLPAFGQGQSEKGETSPPPGEKEKISPSIRPEALWDGRKMVPFRSLDYPTMVKAGEAAFLEDSEYVLGITVNGESRAYPTRFIWWHHVINDKVGPSQVPDEKTRFFAVSYCSVCNTGVRFDPVVEGKPLLLDFYGLYNGIVALCDRESGSALLQVSGEFVKGPRTGSTLKMHPVLDTTWGRWKTLHPDTLVMSPETPYKRYYRPEPRGYGRFPAPFFRPSVTRHDKRLPPFDKVLAVAVRAEEKKPAEGVKTGSSPAETAAGKWVYRAYPIKSLQESSGVLNDTLGSAPLVVLFDAETTTAVAVSRILDGKTLTFEARKQADGKIGYFDQETGSRWNIEGLAEEGPMKGKNLPVLRNHLSQWYGWVAYYPETSIYGRTDPPQTENGFPDPDTEPKKEPSGDEKKPDRKEKP